jgi:hypothetical protein
VQRGGQDVQRRADLGPTLALIQQSLRFHQPLGGQTRPFPPRRWGEKGGTTALTVRAAIAFDRRERHAERHPDLPLRGRPVDDQLGRAKAEAGQVGGGVSEDGQVAVELNALRVAALDSQRLIDFGGAGGKDRQLHLRHVGKLFGRRAGGQAQT